MNCWGYDHELNNLLLLSQANRKIKEDIIFDRLSDFVKSIKNYPDLIGNFCRHVCRAF